MKNPIGSQMVIGSKMNLGMSGIGNNGLNNGLNNNLAIDQ